MQNKFKLNKTFSFLIVIIFLALVFYGGVIALKNNEYSTSKNLTETGSLPKEYDLYEDSIFSIAYDYGVSIAKAGNPFYPSLGDTYVVLGFGSKDASSQYEVELKSGSGELWMDDTPAWLPPNIKLEGRQQFGEMIYVVFTDSTINRRVFEAVYNGSEILISIPIEHSLPKYLDLSSLIIKHPGQDILVNSDVISKLQQPLEICDLSHGSYYYHLGMAYDGSNIVYDYSGKMLAECGGGWGIKPNPYPGICSEIDVARLANQCGEVK